MPDLSGRLDRQPTLQTINWLLNLRRFDQLELNPPYQRKSVWSLRERQRFLDTVLRNYPSPAIFLHAALDAEGNPTYNVVDGKQRLTTILDFVDNKLRIAKDFGDSRLDNAKWSDLEGVPSARKVLWNYQLTVEMIDDVQEPLVREIFSRLNRNSRKLEPQEIRHAKFDGWLITYLESQAELELWRTLKLSTRARQKRMTDVQLLSEFAQVIVEGRTAGFNQDDLDQLYADLEDPAESLPDFDTDDFTGRFETASLALLEMDRHNKIVSTVSGSRNHMYSLWAFVALERPDAEAITALAEAYERFIQAFEEVRQKDKDDPARDRSGDDARVLAYAQASTGATTEAPQREARHDALRDYLHASLAD